MRVSVVITCYNLASYVAAAIESVLKQESGDYEREIIVVDDASTDESVAIIQTYRECRLIRMRENSGVLLTTLAGMSAASGELISLLDADDIWHPRKLRTVVSAFRADPSLACFFHGFSLIDANGAPLRSHRAAITRLNDPASVDRQIREGIYGKECPVHLITATLRPNSVRLDEFAKWVGTLPSPRTTYQDWALAYWMAAATEGRLGYTPKRLLKYRLHGRNYSGDASTISKMLRNLEKSRCTRQAGLTLLEARRPNSVCRAHRAQVEVYDYLIHLYRGRTRAAWKSFFRCVLGNVWPFSRLLKESVRLVGVSVVGPERFLRLTK
jgi:glycosyltransferase involved in cell wall biosynthesis